jgi:hypothetical protein
MHLMWVMQVHHIDTDYYNHFFGGDAYGPTHAAPHGDLASMRPDIGTMRVQHSKISLPMSALGHKRTLHRLRPMSALPPKTDIAGP